MSESNIVCPKCGFQYAHIQSVAHLKNEYGIGTTLFIIGECGHIWKTHIKPCKGIIEMESSFIGECSKE